MNEATGINAVNFVSYSIGEKSCLSFVIDCEKDNARIKKIAEHISKRFKMPIVFGNEYVEQIYNSVSAEL